MKEIAIVTGGTRGIGRAIALRLKQSGATVVATYASNDSAATEFTQQTDIQAIKWNASDYGDCQKQFTKIATELGAVTVLVNNAGITRDAPLHKMTEQQWDEVMVADLKSCFSMTRAVIESMRSHGYGRIINISSINAQRGQFGQSNYCAAKAGMIGFTKALALEAASKGITVNAITPGYIDTEMVAAVPPQILAKIIAQIPTGRLGMGEEIAHAVAFLAARESGFINGAVIPVNGGHYLFG